MLKCTSFIGLASEISCMYGLQGLLEDSKYKYLAITLSRCPLRLASDSFGLAGYAQYNKA